MIGNVLANRYASAAMRDIWSAESKIIAERRLWLAVLEVTINRALWMFNYDFVHLGAGVREPRRQRVQDQVVAEDGGEEPDSDPQPRRLLAGQQRHVVRAGGSGAVEPGDGSRRVVQRQRQ